jgi:hypothetical protein
MERDDNTPAVKHYRWPGAVGTAVHRSQANDALAQMERAWSAEVDALRAEIAGYIKAGIDDGDKIRALRAERDEANDVLAMVEREASKYKAEVERMRPVVDAAARFVKRSGDPKMYRDLHTAVDAWASEQEATDA